MYGHAMGLEFDFQKLLDAATGKGLEAVKQAAITQGLQQVLQSPDVQAAITQQAADVRKDVAADFYIRNEKYILAGGAVLLLLGIYGTVKFMGRAG